MACHFFLNCLVPSAVALFTVCNPITVSMLQLLSERSFCALFIWQKLTLKTIARCFLLCEVSSKLSVLLTELITVSSVPLAVLFSCLLKSLTQRVAHSSIAVSCSDLYSDELWSPWELACVWLGFVSVCQEPE